MRWKIANEARNAELAKTVEGKIRSQVESVLTYRLNRGS